MRQSIVTLMLLICSPSFSQVGIGTTTPDSSAVLDICSKTKGVLIPRMTMLELEDIDYLFNGLLVYVTDAIELFEGGWFYINGQSFYYPPSIFWRVMLL